MAKTAILVDGGFYRKRAARLWGKKTAEERAKELNAYCMAHLNDHHRQEDRQLYRIFTMTVNLSVDAAYIIH